MPVSAYLKACLFMIAAATMFPCELGPLIQIYLSNHNTIGPLLAEVTPLAMLCGSNASTLGPFQIRAVTLSRFQHRPGTGFWGLNGPSADHAE